MNEKSYTEAPLSSFHKRIFLCIVLGQVACGYALGIAGTALTQATDPLNLSSFWVGLLGAGTLIGLFGSLIVGNIADKIGRRPLFISHMILFTVLSLAQFFVSNVIILFAIRVGIGISIAIDYTIGNALLIEWFPKKHGSRFQSYIIIFWMSGFVASYIAGIVITGLGDNTWRWIIISSAIPGLITAVSRLVINIPESPSWLASVGRKEEAISLIHHELGDEYTIVDESEDVKHDKPASWSELFSPGVFRNVVVGGIFYACQVFPFFGIGIFLPLLLKNMNIGNPSVSGILYNGFQIVGAIIGVILFKYISRRFFIVSTFYAAAAALGALIIWRSAPASIMMVIFSIFAVVMSASVILENPYPSELFDTRLRGSGVGAVIAISRVGAALGTFLLPIITSSFGVYASLLVCLIFLLVGGIVCQIWAPETSPKFMKAKNAKVQNTKVKNVKSVLTSSLDISDDKI
ncbi:MFS transporter [Companilactobacillus insicii]|uniref:MFS transporter n=1 Tax=Companilactobacillus insicii TaxID=1732567 RepID=UPI001FE6FF18|nr:MFS transporter [Companilactobacillus insicii]